MYVLITFCNTAKVIRSSPGPPLCGQTKTQCYKSHCSPGSDPTPTPSIYADINSRQKHPCSLLSSGLCSTLQFLVQSMNSQNALTFHINLTVAHSIFKLRRAIYKLHRYLKHTQHTEILCSVFQGCI